jgi:hypothetical protein
MISKITSNFSFGKLLNKIESIQDHYLNKSKAKIIDIAKNNINSNELRALKPSTEAGRRAGRGWSGKKVQPTNDMTPLKHTKNLLNSLKVTEDGFSVAEYGMIHQSGWDSKGRFKGKIKPRRFLPFTSKGNFTPEMKEFNGKFEKLLLLRIKQAMKK